MRVLTLLASHLMPCGCLAGIYETYGGPVVGIIDDRADDCPESQHRRGLVVPAPMPLFDDPQQHAAGVL
jgi:hypothetical protein